MNSNRIRSEVVTLTPDKCREILAKNEHNRNPSKRTISLYAQEIQQGLWQINGEPIIIDDSGNVLDGQHRLYACIEANRPFTTLIVRNVNRNTFATIDTGKIRTGADVLTIQGLSPEIARICAAAAATCIPFEKTGILTPATRGTKYLVTPETRAKWVNDNKDIIEIAYTIQSYGTRARRVISAGDAAFLWFFMEKKDPEPTVFFFDGLYTGANLRQHDPRLALLTRFESMNASNKRFTRLSKLGFVVRAWDWYRRGKLAPIPGNMFRDPEIAPYILKPDGAK